MTTNDIARTKVLQTKAVPIDGPAGADPMRVWASLLGEQACSYLFRDVSLHEELDRSATTPWRLPVIPERPRPAVQRQSFPTGSCGPKSESEVLIGVIDSGCPFAHASLARWSSAGGLPSPIPNSTRVLAIWDQDPFEPAYQKLPGAWTPVGFGPSGTGYGCAVPRTALEELMRVHDEEASYRHCGDTRLRPSFAHGAAVLNLLAGDVPLGDRMIQRRDSLPRWKPGSDLASRSDVVCVQLPRDAVQDSSSAGLEDCLLDGLRFIVDQAGPMTRRIVVNISDGSSRGTHDRHSRFAREVKDLILQAKRRRKSLHIVLPAGNAFAEARHAKLRPSRGSAASVVLALPPGCEAPAFVTLRTPPNQEVQWRICPPGHKMAADEGWIGPGNAMLWSRSAVTPTVAALVRPNPKLKRAEEALIAWAATHTERSDARAPSGYWSIECRCLPGSAGRSSDTPSVHLWISRNQRNVGAMARAHQAYFVDLLSNDDPLRHLREADDDPDRIDSAFPPSPVRRRGTLNALASAALEPTDTNGGVVVVGGVFASHAQAAPYSATGAGERDSRWQRGSPHVSAISDESWGLRGIRAGANRSGEVRRVIGTSFAAPQVARAIVNSGWPLPPDSTVAVNSPQVQAHRPAAATAGQPLRRRGPPLTIDDRTGPSVVLP